MNKKLIAAAVAAGLVMPGLAMADATVYGKLNVGISQIDTDAATNSSALTANSHDSRFGIKGEEDLGGGLKAYFKLETEIDVDDGGAVTWARDKYVGLKGGWGAVQVGEFNTAYKNVFGKMDIFADSIGDVTGSGSHGELDDRFINMLAYKNKFGSFSIDLNYAFAESDLDNVDDGYAVGLGWSGGGFMVTGGIVNMDSNQLGTAATQYDEGTRVGFQWKGGMHKVNALYEMVDKLAANADYDVVTAQYALTMGNNMFGLSYTAMSADAANSDTTQMTVGWHHMFSKKTKLAVAYTTVDNDANVANSGRILNTDSGTNLNPVPNGGDPSQLGVMVTHSF